jgi:hypothetical protein
LQRGIISEKFGDDLETGRGDAERGKQPGAANERGNLKRIGTDLTSRIRAFSTIAFMARPFVDPAVC